MKGLMMQYTVNKLATLSGVTIRTLRFYDEIGLLKPAHVAENGYRYYTEKELLLLQQILFFRELGFELKQIQNIMGQSDFNKLEALRTHKKILLKNITRMTELIKTVDNTINHLEGKKIMNDTEIFYGFDSEQQTKHEDYLITHYGDDVKGHIAQSHKNIEGWTMTDWQTSKTAFADICTELTFLLKQHHKPDSVSVQAVIKKHYEWLKNFWLPNKESYTGMGIGYTAPEWTAIFEPYHPQLAQYLADAIGIFAEKNLS
jgi:DNA-binding transcriptional MerR regulator